MKAKLATECIPINTYSQIEDKCAQYIIAYLSQLIASCRANITKASYGEATLHKQSDDDCKCFVLNGQQRLISITILLSVLRHLARKRYTDQLQLQKIDTIMLPATLFTFREAESMSAVTRIQVRDLQGDFFATYISPAVDSLGSFWDEEGKLLDGLAGHDTINRRFMQVADAFKQVLNICAWLTYSALACP